MAQTYDRVLSAPCMLMYLLALDLPAPVPAPFLSSVFGIVFTAFSLCMVETFRAWQHGGTSRPHLPPRAARRASRLLHPRSCQGHDHTRPYAPPECAREETPRQCATPPERSPWTA